MREELLLVNCLRMTLETATDIMDLFSSKSIVDCGLQANPDKLMQIHNQTHWPLAVLLGWGTLVLP